MLTIYLKSGKYFIPAVSQPDERGFTAENVEAAQAQLAKLNAFGGGDEPERIEKALGVALSRGMGWKPETNKLMVVIGDAPHHPDAMETAKKLAREAREKPLGKSPNVVAGAKPTKETVRPFAVSTIGVGTASVAAGTESAFKEIASAGGGAYGTLLTNAAGGGRNSGEKIVEQILRLSFGEEWEKPVAAFVGVYLEYRKAGLFR